MNSKNPWSERFNFVVTHIPIDCTVVDFGCGNQEILNFYKPKEYLGIDKIPNAMMNLNLDIDDIKIKNYDVGLLLGVLEYVDNPDIVLNKIKNFANMFLILTLPVKKKLEWKRAFTEDSISKLLTAHFNSVENFRYNRYILSKVSV
jgi:hypothetical protein